MNLLPASFAPALSFPAWAFDLPDLPPGSRPVYKMQIGVCGFMDTSQNGFNLNEKTPEATRINTRTIPAKELEVLS